MIRTLDDLGLESEIPDFIARSESAKNDLFSKSRLLPIYAHFTSECTTSFGGGGQISYRLSNYPGIESAIHDFIIRSESAKNDFFSKPWLHCIYALEPW